MVSHHLMVPPSTRKLDDVSTMVSFYVQLTSIHHALSLLSIMKLRSFRAGYLRRVGDSNARRTWTTSSGLRVEVFGAEGIGLRYTEYDGQLDISKEKEGLQCIHLHFIVVLIIFWMVLDV